MRIGIGVDSHQFAPGRKLILGGVEVPYERGLAGHPNLLLCDKNHTRASANLSPKRRRNSAING